MNKLTDQHNVSAAAAHVEQGMAHFEAHRFDEAMAEFEAALALDPNCAEAWNGIGRVRYHIGPLDAAIAAYERAISLNPHYIDPYYGIGILLSAKLGEYDKALAVFQRGLDNNPGDGWMTDSIGSTYARMGQLDKAVAVLEASCARNPADAFALSWLSLIYLKQKRFDAVIAACQRENSVEEAHSPHRIMGMVYDHLGDHDLAIVHLERAIALEPQDYEARAVLAQVYRAVGRQAEANEQDARADEMAGQDEEYGHACVQALRGHVDEAVALLRIALPKKLVMPGWARIDPEFAFISDDPRFKALVGE